MGKRVRVGMIATIRGSGGLRRGRCGRPVRGRVHLGEDRHRAAAADGRGGYKLVGTEELKAWIDAKKDLLIVDTMPYEDSYKKEHVPGARQFLFPIPDMKTWDAKETGGKSEQDFVQLLGPDKNRLIVIYCGFVKCTRSHNGADLGRQERLHQRLPLPRRDLRVEGRQVPDRRGQVSLPRPRPP